MEPQAGYSSLNELPLLQADMILRRTAGLVGYQDALTQMETDVAALQNGTGPEVLWLLEHPPLYTAGITAKPADLLTPDRFPVFPTGRGGQYTYHGPGQRVAYVMLDLRRRGRDVRAYVASLERWIVAALARLGVEAGVRDGRVGVWVDHADGREEKIAAIGVRVSRWTTFHGIALNVHPDLSHFEGIVPCGIRAHGVTSLAALGLHTTMATVDKALIDTFKDIIAPRRVPE